MKVLDKQEGGSSFEIEGDSRGEIVECAVCGEKYLG
jgi:hypothetical protein